MLRPAHNPPQRDPDRWIRAKRGRRMDRTPPAPGAAPPAGPGDPLSSKTVESIDRVVIRFAGDSGDGMQLTGDRFTSDTAAMGNDLSTLPNFPAEIRAPQGTLPGVSSFQLHFADHDVLTPGDAPDVLVAMNPAALKANLADVPRGATIIANTDEFGTRNLAKVGYAANPLEDGSLESWHVHGLPLTSMTVEALAGFDLTRKEKERAKNMFALGLLSWMYSRPTDATENFLAKKFGSMRMIKIFIVMYMAICLFGYGLDTELEFWILAVSVGICQGGIQALSRSYYGKIIPKDESSEYFGFFDVFGKFADFFGPLIISFCAYFFHNSKYGVLSLILLFAVGLILITLSEKQPTAAE